MHNSIETTHKQWHEFAKTCNVKELLALYAEQACFESPLVIEILGGESGILRAHAQNNKRDD